MNAAAPGPGNGGSAAPDRPKTVAWPADPAESRHGSGGHAPCSRPASRFVAAFSVFAAVFLAGAVAPLDPDCDVTFGIEAWRRPGWIACAGAALLVLAILRDDRAAGRIADRIGHAARCVPPAARIPAVLAFAAAAFALVADVSLSGDAMEAVGRAMRRDTMPSNALTSWLHFAACAAGLDALQAVRAVSVTAGVAGVAACIALGRAMFDDTGRRTAVTVLAATTGAVTLWFGSIEVYAPAGAAIVAYLAAAVRCIRGRGRPALPAFLLGVAFVLHGSAGLLLPSLVLLAWRTADDGSARAAMRGSCRSSRMRAAAAALAVFAIPVACVAAALVTFVWHGEVPASGPARWGNFSGASGDGPLLPWMPDAALRSRYAIVDAEHALAVVSALFVAAPAAWFLLAVRRDPVWDGGVAETPGGSGSAPGAATDDAACITPFALTALVPWIAFLCLWNVSYGLRRDWDLFSAAAFPAVVLASRVALRRPPGGAAVLRVAAVALFTFVPLVVTHAGTRLERRDFALAADFTLRGSAGRRWIEAAQRHDPARIVERIVEGERQLAARRPVPALAVLTSALSDEPGDVFVHEARARALEALGQSADARAGYAAALLTPRENLRFTARLGLARIATRAGDAAEARRQLGRALREDSENPRAAEARALLREMR